MSENPHALRGGLTVDDFSESVIVYPTATALYDLDRTAVVIAHTAFELSIEEAMRSLHVQRLTEPRLVDTGSNRNPSMWGCEYRVGQLTMKATLRLAAGDEKA